MSKRPIHQYKEEQLAEAMAAIRNGMKIREASRVFKVSRGTLQDRLHLRVPDLPRKMGPDSVLTKTEETALKDWCIALAKCGFPLKRDDLLNTVHNIISEDKRPNPFVNNRPGKKWNQSFLRRNPELSERTPEDISKGRAIVTEEGIRKWFAELMKHLEDINASDILTTSILNKYLTLPAVSRSKYKIKSINRIGAISSKEWRQFERKKEEMKEQKKNEIICKKLKRLEIKAKKEEEKQKKKE